MPAHKNKRIAVILLSIIGGITFAAFALYNQSGKIGKTEVISLALTAIIAIVISIIIIKKSDK
jgi:hypothetical protein